MPQVFHRSSNAIARLSLLGGAAAAAIVGAVAFYLVRSDYATGAKIPPEQPVPFSHAHHAGGDGIDCRYCHTTVETSSYAGVPPTETCMNCHSQIWTNSPNLALVRQSFQDGDPIEWTRVHDLPDFVYFNHSIHISKGIGCSTCHGDVTTMNLTWQDQPLNMTWCLDCHSQPEKYVRERKDIYDMDYQPPANQMELGHRLVREYGIEKKLSCSVCHR